MFAFRPSSFRPFRRRGFDAVFAPRKPRHRILRVVLTLLGVGLLVVLLAFGLVIGATMLGIGLLYRLWRQRGKPLATPPGTLEGEYRILRKPVLTTGR
jgi:hypothetical protein